METAEALPEIKKFMTVQEVSEIVGISDDYLYKQIKRNKGPRVTRFGRLFRIHPDDFRRWIDNPAKTVPRTGPASPKRKP